MFTDKNNFAVLKKVKGSTNFSSKQALTGLNFFCLARSALKKSGL